MTDWQLCPIGFHVPSDNDWKILEAHLGMPADEVESTGDFRGISAGVHLALKAESSLWTYPGNNSTLFSALPGGVTNSNNDICFLNGETLDGNWAMFGSSSLDDAGDMWFRLLSDFDGANRFRSYPSILRRGRLFFNSLRPRYRVTPYKKERPKMASLLVLRTGLEIRKVYWPERRMPVFTNFTTCKLTSFSRRRSALRKGLEHGNLGIKVASCQDGCPRCCH